MWAHRDMKIQIPQCLGLTRRFSKVFGELVYNSSMKVLNTHRKEVMPYGKRKDNNRANYMV